MGTALDGEKLYHIMDQVLKRFDPTRKTTVAQFPARAGGISQRSSEYKLYTMPPELAQATEIASLNYQSAWYGEFVKHCPEMNIFQSEAKTSNWLAPYYNMYHEHSIGMAYWGSIAYWGESNGWPKDAKGNVVSYYEEELTVDVAGPARLLAIDNGEHYTNDLFVNVNTKKMLNGRMQVILRAGRTDGKVSVRVSTPRFKKVYKTLLPE